MRTAAQAIQNGNRVSIQAPTARILLNVQRHGIGRASIRSHNHRNCRSGKSRGNGAVDLIQRRISWSSPGIANVAGLSADCDDWLNLGIVEISDASGRAKAREKE